MQSLDFLLFTVAWKVGLCFGAFSDDLRLARSRLDVKRLPVDNELSVLKLCRVRVRRLPVRQVDEVQP